MLTIKTDQRLPANPPKVMDLLTLQAETTGCPTPTVGVMVGRMPKVTFGFPRVRVALRTAAHIGTSRLQAADIGTYIPAAM